MLPRNIDHEPAISIFQWITSDTLPASHWSRAQMLQSHWLETGKWPRIRTLRTWNGSFLTSPIAFCFTPFLNLINILYIYSQYTIKAVVIIKALKQAVSKCCCANPFYISFFSKTEGVFWQNQFSDWHSHRPLSWELQILTSDWPREASLVLTRLMLWLTYLRARASQISA